MNNLPKVLIVDDEDFNREVLKQELDHLEVQILTARNGGEALDIIFTDQPDIIFLDIMMPVMDGFEVLRRLKSNPQWSDIPVVIISASNDMPSIVKGIEMGAEDFLPKPFDPILLHARLNAGLEKKRLRDIEKRYLENMERELEIGREIQAGFLPKHLPHTPGWEIEAYFQAAREVSGDFYDVFSIDSNKLVLLLGDVTDKGVGSALYMALFRSLLRAAMVIDSFSDCGEPTQALLPGPRLKQAITLVNNYICEIHDSEMYATLFLGILNTQSGELIYINGGQDFPYLLRDEVVLSKLMPTGPAVGAIEGAAYETQRITISPGDTLVFYSDGITDAMNSQGDMFGRERWENLLDSPSSNEKSVNQHLSDTILDFIGSASQYDDISLLTVQRCRLST